METTHTVNAAAETVDGMASGAHEAVDKMADVVAQAAEALNVKGEQLKDFQAAVAGVLIYKYFFPYS